MTYLGSQGNGYSYNNLTFAENEERSPWGPLHVQHGFKPDESAVSLRSQFRSPPGPAAAAFAELERAVAEDPRGAAWQHVNPFEQRPVLQHAAASYKLSESLRVQPTKFGTDRKNCLGFHCKIEGPVRLVIVNPVEPVPVIEK